MTQYRGSSNTSSTSVGGLRFLLEAAFSSFDDPHDQPSPRMLPPKHHVAPTRLHNSNKRPLQPICRWSDEAPPLPRHLFGLKLRMPALGLNGGSSLLQDNTDVGNNNHHMSAYQRQQEEALMVMSGGNNSNNKKRRRRPAGGAVTAAGGEDDEEHADPTQRMRQAEGHWRAGHMCMERGDYGTANRAYSEALKIFPQSIEARDGRARARLKLGRLPESLEDALQATLTRPSDGETWARLSEVQRAMGLGEAARHSIIQAMSIDPSSARWDAALLHLRSDQRPPALPTTTVVQHDHHYRVGVHHHHHHQQQAVTAAGEGPSPSEQQQHHHHRPQQYDGSEQQQQQRRSIIMVVDKPQQHHHHQQQQQRVASHHHHSSSKVVAAIAPPAPPRISKEEMRELMLEALRHVPPPNTTCSSRSTTSWVRGSGNNDEQQGGMMGGVVVAHMDADDDDEPGVQERQAFARHLSCDASILDDLYSQGHAADICRNPACTSAAAATEAGWEEKGEGGESVGCVDFQMFPKDPRAVARWIVTGHCAKCLGVEVTTTTTTTVKAAVGGGGMRGDKSGVVVGGVSL